MLPQETSHLTNDIDILLKSLSWLNRGQKVAIATVIQTWGSSPRPTGSQMAIAEDGQFDGSVSGGCIEGEVVTEALSCIRKQKNKNLDFSISTEQAREAGLSCGGHLMVVIIWVSRTIRDILVQIIEDAERHRCSGLLIDTVNGSCNILRQEENKVLDSFLTTGQNGFVMPEDKKTIFLRSYSSGVKLFIVGAVHIAQYLAKLGVQAGYAVSLIDPRDNWATLERFPGIVIDRRWPSDAINNLIPDQRTAITVLSHDPKIDDPAIVSALNSKAFYIGALGSRRTHEKRKERLKLLGFSDKQMKRIFAPIGLNIEANTPFEIAVSILGQVIQANRHHLQVSQS